MVVLSFIAYGHERIHFDPWCKWQKHHAPRLPNAPLLYTPTVLYKKLKIFKYVFTPGWSASTDAYHFFAQESVLFTYSE
jgi:hypothetical protein